MAFKAAIARNAERRLIQAKPSLAEPMLFPTPLDRAWRAIDALGGRYPEGEYWKGYAAGLDAAVTEIEKLGGRDFDAVIARLRASRVEDEAA